jgi:hypothetical protein
LGEQAKRPIDKKSGEQAKRPIDKKSGEQAKRPIDKKSGEQAKRPIDKKSGEQAKRTIDKKSGEQAKRPIDKKSGEQAKRPIDKKLGEQAKRPIDKNPFEALDLDPNMDLRELTAELRERAEELLPHERATLQKHWQQITFSASERAEHALLARPRHNKAARLELALRKVPPPALPSSEAQSLADDALSRLELRELVPLPPLGRMQASPSSSDALPFADDESFEDDPFFSLLSE